MLFVPRVMRVLNEGCDLRQAARLPHQPAVLPVLDRATQGVHLVLEPLQQRAVGRPLLARALFPIQIGPAAFAPGSAA